MAKRTRNGDGWARPLERIIELAEWIIQPGGPLARAVCLILACALLAAAIGIVVIGMTMLYR